MSKAKQCVTNPAARRGMSLAVAAFAAAATGPVPAADMLNGGRLYAVHCASCHGPTGVSVMPNAPNFARGDGLLRPDNALLSAIRSGKAAMPAYVGILSDREILDVIAYLRTLR
ncbi:MAG: cytochrome c [Burkholderiales bacterium]